MKKHWKFGALAAIVCGAIVFIATTGVKDSGSYYKTVAEIRQMGDKAVEKRVRVGGDVVEGSIQLVNSQKCFLLSQDNQKLKVVYTGRDPLPDTFRDGAQALADGRLGRDGVFYASQIQAKCASKYEGKPKNLRAAPAQPVNKS